VSDYIELSNFEQGNADSNCLMHTFDIRKAIGEVVAINELQA